MHTLQHSPERNRKRCKVRLLEGHDNNSATIPVMYTLAHNGHDHAEEMTQTASNYPVGFVAGGVVLTIATIVLVLILKRKN